MKEILCFDSQGNRIEGLCQWDTEQKLYFHNLGVTSAPDFHFYNQAVDSENTYISSSTLSESIVSVVVPNVLLQKSGTLKIYIYTEDTSGGTTTGTTIAKVRLTILSKKKPIDYIDNQDLIRSGSVTTAKIADGAVTLAKLDSDVFESTPTNGSSKLLTSGGAFTALGSKLPYIVYAGGGSGFTISEINNLDITSGVLYWIFVAAGVLYPSSVKQMCLLIKINSNTEIFISNEGRIFRREYNNSTWGTITETCAPISLVSSTESRVTSLENTVGTLNDDLETALGSGSHTLSYVVNYENLGNKTKAELDALTLTTDTLYKVRFAANFFYQGSSSRYGYVLPFSEYVRFYILQDAFYQSIYSNNAWGNCVPAIVGDSLRDETVGYNKLTATLQDKIDLIPNNPMARKHVGTLSSSTALNSADYCLSDAIIEFIALSDLAAAIGVSNGTYCTLTYFGSYQIVTVDNTQEKFTRRVIAVAPSFVADGWAKVIDNIESGSFIYESTSDSTKTMTGTYNLNGDYCFITAEAGMTSGAVSTSYPLPVASTTPVASIGLGGGEYFVKTNSGSTVTISKMDGSTSAGVPVSFELTYKYK